MKTPFRWDRAVSLHVTRPFHRLFPAPGYNRLAILMYHSISDAVEDVSLPYYRLRTPPARFEEQLYFLRSNGHNVLPLHQAADQFMAGTLRGRNVSITFDDGLLDYYTDAFPLLRKYRYASTVFLPVEYITRRDLHLKGEEHLSWDQVIALSKMGVCFGSHTLTHRRLDLLERPDMEREVRCSKDIIEEHLGSAVRAFSYPFAFPEAGKRFIPILRECLVRSGYTVGVTTKIGTVQPGQDRLFLHRVPVNSRDDPSLFQAKLEGNYNWLHGFQYAAKWARQRLLSWT